MANKKAKPGLENENFLKSREKKEEMKIIRKIRPNAIFTPLDSRTVKLPFGSNFALLAIVLISEISRNSHIHHIFKLPVTFRNSVPIFKT